MKLKAWIVRYGLKPCPFCGAEKSKDEGATGIWVWQLQGIHSPWLVQCECGARTHYRLKLKEAIQTWNHRI